MRSDAPQTTTTTSQADVKISADPVSGCVSTGSSSPTRRANVTSSAGSFGVLTLA